MIRLANIIGELARPPAPETAASDTPRAEPAAVGPPVEAPAPASLPPAGPLFDELALSLACAILQSESAPFPWTALEERLGLVVDSLVASADLLWVAHARPAPPMVDWLALHHARTAVLALRLGLALAYPRERLLALGLAACLFDAGLGRPGDRPVDEATDPRAWRAHAERSAELVAAWAPRAPSVVTAVLHHHERERGQGFPGGIAGDAIDPHAKVIGLADAYTRLTLPPSWRPPRAPHHAVRELVRTRGESFPAGLVRALVMEVTMFPPGTRVRLSTGERARVVAVHATHPLRPQIEIVANAKGKPLPSRMLDLRDTPFIYIAGPAEAEP